MNPHIATEHKKVREAIDYAVLKVEEEEAREHQQIETQKNLRILSAKTSYYSGPRETSQGSSFWTKLMAVCAVGLGFLLIIRVLF